jgi:hypothetical protein
MKLGPEALSVQVQKLIESMVLTLDSRLLIPARSIYSLRLPCIEKTLTVLVLERFGRKIAVLGLMHSSSSSGEAASLICPAPRTRVLFLSFAGVLSKYMFAVVNFSKSSHIDLIAGTLFFP